jgi:hypothetical protein
MLAARSSHGSAGVPSVVAQAEVHTPQLLVTITAVILIGLYDFGMPGSG